jgi:hypothetical protein
MPCQAQEHSGGCTASRPHRSTAAAIEAAIVDEAGRGGQLHRCAPRCDKLLDRAMWTEIALSARSGVVVHRQPARLAAPASNPYLRHSILLRILIYRGCEPARAVVIAARALSSTEHRVTDDLELLITAMACHQAHHHQCSLAAATRQIRALVAESRAEYRAQRTLRQR